MTPLALSLLWPAVCGQILGVRSETQCPAAERVEERVLQILDLKGKRIEERAVVTREAQSLRVVLRGADGRDVGERVLSADASCEDLAQAVAVVLATWISDVHPEFVGTLPQPEPTQATPEATPAPTTPFVESEAVARSTIPPVTFAHDIARAENGSSTWLSRRLEPGLGIGVGVAGPKAAATASLLVAWMPARSGVGLVASATFASAREQPLADGTLVWMRWPLAAGLALRLPLRHAAIDVAAGGALAWSHLAGRGFPATSAASTSMAATSSGAGGASGTGASGTGAATTGSGSTTTGAGGTGSTTFDPCVLQSLKSCRAAGCHTGTPVSAGLHLDDNVLLYDARAVLVDRPNQGTEGVTALDDPTGCPPGAFLLIDSVNPAASLLWRKPTPSGETPMTPCGSKMPVIGTFTVADKQCLQNWITSVLTAP